MIKVELTEKEVVMLAGILGATEGITLNTLYYQLLDEVKKSGNVIVVEDITNLIYEEIHLQDDPSINEDYLYLEACKLNGLLD